MRAGYAVSQAAWAPGDEIRLELPLAPRWTHPDPHVDAELGEAITLSAGDLKFIPYHVWGNRGLATMRVWVPTS